MTWKRDVAEACHGRKRHTWMIAPKSGRTILCVYCGKRLRNGTPYAKRQKFKTLDEARQIWKRLRQERRDAEYAEFYD